jgi:hypothetical protein
MKKLTTFLLGIVLSFSSLGCGDPAGGQRDDHDHDDGQKGQKDDGQK